MVVEGMNFIIIHGFSDLIPEYESRILTHA